MTDKTTSQATRYYDTTFLEWAGTHNTPRFWGDWYDKFQGYLPKGRILEIGCGGGRDAQELLSLGYEYLGTDPSTGMLEIAAEQVGSERLQNIGVEDFQFEGEFDGFWASASLLHRSLDTIQQDLRNIRRAVKENGIGFISLKKHVDELPAERIVEDGRPFTFWKEEDFVQQLHQAGFEVLEFDEKPMSESTVWLVFIVQAVQTREQ